MFLMARLFVPVIVIGFLSALRLVAAVDYNQINKNAECAVSATYQLPCLQFPSFFFINITLLWKSHAPKQ